MKTLTPEVANEIKIKTYGTMTDLIFTPTRVETVLVSSHKTYYVNDEQRIGFQKGVKWLIEQQRIDIEDVTEALKQAKKALEGLLPIVEESHDMSVSAGMEDYQAEEEAHYIKQANQAIETINKLRL